MLTYWCPESSDDGEEETVTHTTRIIYIKVNSLTYEEGAAAYSFTAEQMEIADEMMSPDYYTLYAELLGVDLLGGADLTKIISNLPVETQGGGRESRVDETWIALCYGCQRPE